MVSPHLTTEASKAAAAKALAVADDKPAVKSQASKKVPNPKTRSQKAERQSASTNPTNGEAKKVASKRSKTKSKAAGQAVTGEVANKGSEQPPELSEAELAEQQQRMNRIAGRILTSIVRSMPTIYPNLKISGNDNKVSHGVDIASIAKFESLIQGSYVIVKGDKNRTVYFIIHDKILFGELKSILLKDAELRENLTKLTVNIQFGCPSSGQGLRFKRISKGLFRGKRTAMYAFDLRADSSK